MKYRPLGKVMGISLILKLSLVGLFDLDESEEDEDDLLQRTGNFISTSTSLPKGILKVRVGEVGPLQLTTSETQCASQLRMYGFMFSVGLNMLLPFILLLQKWSRRLNYVPRDLLAVVFEFSFCVSLHFHGRWPGSCRRPLLPRVLQSLRDWSPTSTLLCSSCSSFSHSQEGSSEKKTSGHVTFHRFLKTSEFFIRSTLFFIIWHLCMSETSSQKFSSYFLPKFPGPSFCFLNTPRTFLPQNFYSAPCLSVLEALLMANPFVPFYSDDT